jgi:hypothetical protein
LKGTNAGELGRKIKELDKKKGEELSRLQYRCSSISVCTMNYVRMSVTAIKIDG